MKTSLMVKNNMTPNQMRRLAGDGAVFRQCSKCKRFQPVGSHPMTDDWVDGELLPGQLTYWRSALNIEKIEVADAFCADRYNEECADHLKKRR